MHFSEKIQCVSGGNITLFCYVLPVCVAFSKNLGLCLDSFLKKISTIQYIGVGREYLRRFRTHLRMRLRAFYVGRYFPTSLLQVVLQTRVCNSGCKYTCKLDCKYTCKLD